MKKSRMRWAGCVACMGARGMHIYDFGKKAKGNNPL
jgi:hypothetical protein